MENEVIPLAAPELAALPAAATAILKWDVANALMESAFLDAHPPVFFTTLIDIYRTGHLPAGGGAECSELVVF